METDRVERLIAELLLVLGEDPEREALQRTPQRVAALLRKLTAGYRMQNAECQGVQEAESGLVVLRDIAFVSLCEHHLMPFFGSCSVGYVPRGRILGLGSIDRIVQLYARRLQVQERLTAEIAEGVVQAISPEGVGVVMEARHLCTAAHPALSASTLRTTALLGALREDAAQRGQFFASLR